MLVYTVLELILPIFIKFDIFSPLVLSTRFLAELGETPCVHRADPGGGESSLQSTKDQTGYAQVRSHLPRVVGGSDHGQKQGQDLQNAGSQDIAGHPLRRVGRGHKCRDGSGEQSQAGGSTTSAGGERGVCGFY